MRGLDLAKKNLRLCECKIFSEQFEPSREIEKFVQEKFSCAIFVAWQIQNVIWGKFDGEKFLLNDDCPPNFDDWPECRICFARLWGERDKNFSADGWIKLEDKPRKLSMIIPCDDGGKKFYGLKTRNYIGSDDETGLSGYVDYRFVALESAWDGD